MRHRTKVWSIGNESWSTIKTLKRFLRKPSCRSNVGLCRGFRNTFSGRLDGSFETILRLSIGKYIFPLSLIRLYCRKSWFPNVPNTFKAPQFLHAWLVSFQANLISSYKKIGKHQALARLSFSLIFQIEMPKIYTSLSALNIKKINYSIFNSTQMLLYFLNFSSIS